MSTQTTTVYEKHYQGEGMYRIVAQGDTVWEYLGEEILDTHILGEGEDLLDLMVWCRQEMDKWVARRAHRRTPEWEVAYQEGLKAGRRQVAQDLAILTPDEFFAQLEGK